MTDVRTSVIAEAGVNHDGSVEDALRLVDVAAAAGADAVKFQTFRAERLALVDAPKSAYQIRHTDPGESSFDMLARLSLSEADHLRLRDRCRERGIEFISTPFDVDSMRFLVEDVGVARLKLSSADLTNALLLAAAARSGLPVIVSTGMATSEEIADALGLIGALYADPGATPVRGVRKAALQSSEIRALLRQRVTLLHCTSAYPTPLDEVNLRAIRTMANDFDLPVGYSDHTVGIAVAASAVACGAVVIEKHVTLDRTRVGPDHAASLEPDELAAMVRSIREVEVALGHGSKMPTPSERDTATTARRSLVATQDVSRGSLLDEGVLDVRRPGTGMSPMCFWHVVGSPASRDYRTGDLIDEPCPE